MFKCKKVIKIKTLRHNNKKGKICTNEEVL